MKEWRVYTDVNMKMTNDTMSLFKAKISAKILFTQQYSHQHAQFCTYVYAKPVIIPFFSHQLLESRHLAKFPYPSWGECAPSSRIIKRKH